MGWKFRLTLTIRRKLIFSFAIILIIPSIVIGLMSYEIAADKMREEINNFGVRSVNMLDQIINDTIDPKIHDITYFSKQITEPFLQGGAQAPIRERLKEYYALHPELVSVYVGTKEGVMIQEPVQKMTEDYDPRNRPWYQDAIAKKGQTIITEPYVSASTGKVVVTIARTLEDNSGVVAMNLNLDNIAKVVQQVKIGQKGYAFIVDQTGKYLVHPTIKSGTDFKEKWEEELFAKKSGQIELDETNEFISYETNKVTGWKIAGLMFSAEIQETVQPIFTRTLVVIVAALLAGTILMIFVILSITNPLKRLIKASRKISEGDLTETISVNGEDEIGMLSQSFQQMQTNLRTLIGQVGFSADQVAASAEELTAYADQTSKATGQISTTIQLLATGVEKQFHSVEETTETVQRMSLGVEQMASHSEEVTAKAIEASVKATEGSHSIQTAVEQMSSINHTVKKVASVIKGLGERSEEIGKIVDVIANIATQTNLLALNAAIEAARAGEHGRGFAVVANEVRLLAEQSTHSAEQVDKLIMSIQEETNQAVHSMDLATQEAEEGINLINTAGDSFELIQVTVEQVTAQIQEVTAAIKQLSEGSKDMVSSMEMITEVAETAASSTQEVSASTEEQLATMEEITHAAASLAGMAEELQGLLAKFKI
ncbi:methyl-accepting chemotaxis protein [Brevibacillus laterosporus]|uniref:methyl-accepting chemotaxis protein n=1 Tax=Brevibacillus laterosporus TaxID=1465 RepID=UPI001443F176|nr:methyl-accepting chemotaxis protein [Brevibacillus laterosporus]NKQ21207.1 methyl-accepting chemotaxis protein [Brevibacillus laterosporus]WNX31796.1 methyl-accepting chemotaxis protein [Brevibacillus laterosporus]